MRKFIIPALAIHLAGLVAPVFAEENQIKIKPELSLTVGSCSWEEAGTGQGSKFCGEGSLTLNIKEIMPNLDFSLSGKIGHMLEPIDENHNNPNKMYGIEGEIKYFSYLKNKIRINPYIGIGVEKWTRDHFKDSNIPEGKRWDSLKYSKAKAGIRLEGPLGYIEGGPTFQFFVDANKGANPKGDGGFYFEAGKKLEKFGFKVRYRETKFKGSKETPGFKRMTCQGGITYSF
ncbi:MAG TPA: hypothetical protein ENG87_01030 [Candidatus Pacearchaeota archaeon]|nr:hypothetical protein BMS3Abin17_00269 [archaeon BMS3Abin17]HDK41934.1 hypothetical protein [Candidatus Pacearchaeota archaeon]HDZ60650.1 hypothetical protein [Candidatus Pacearchaeota archaeon]